jgi:gamma-glutamyltranspeptidase/glutathione hydrolase
VVTDPRHLTHDPRAFLQAGVFEREAAQISMRRAAPFPLPKPVEGDTIWMGAIDGSGLAVSYIQSLFWEFGSGCVLPQTGILWQNRGTAFSLDPASKNPLEPGPQAVPHPQPGARRVRRRAGDVLRHHGRRGAAAIPGPDLHALCRRRHGRGRRGDAPRWLLGKTWGAEAPTLKVENRFDEGLLADLARWGHHVEEIGKAYATDGPCRHAGEAPPQRAGRGHARSARGRWGVGTLGAQV